MLSIINVINVKSNSLHEVNVVLMSTKTYLNQVTMGLQDLPYQLKNLLGQTIHLKIVVVNITNRVGTLVGTALLGLVASLGTGLSRASTVGTTRPARPGTGRGRGTTSTGSTGQVRRWVWRWPSNRLQNLMSQIVSFLKKHTTTIESLASKNNFPDFSQHLIQRFVCRCSLCLE